GPLSFDNGSAPFDNGSLQFDNGSLSFDHGPLSFDNGPLSFDHDALPEGSPPRAAAIGRRALIPIVRCVASVPVAPASQTVQTEKRGKTPHAAAAVTDPPADARWIGQGADATAGSARLSETTP